jgi:hypothetical protein
MSRISNQHDLSFEPWLDSWPIQKLPEVEILGHTANVCYKVICQIIRRFEHAYKATRLTCILLALEGGSLYMCPLVHQVVNQRSTLLMYYQQAYLTSSRQQLAFFLITSIPIRMNAHEIHQFTTKSMISIL